VRRVLVLFPRARRRRFWVLLLRLEGADREEEGEDANALFLFFPPPATARGVPPPPSNNNEHDATFIAKSAGFTPPDTPTPTFSPNDAGVR
jgi:hypothetical protein